MGICCCYRNAVAQDVAHALRTTKRTCPQSLPVQLSGFLWIAGAKEANDMDFLQSRGITHILNCATDASTVPSVLHQVAVQYMCLQAPDTETYPLLARHMDAVVPFVNDARDSHGHILVHCFMGTNRSVTIALAYFLLTDPSARLADMVAHVARHRPVLSNASFVKQLVKLQSSHCSHPRAAQAAPCPLLNTQRLHFL